MTGSRTSRMNWLTRLWYRLRGCPKCVSMCWRETDGIMWCVNCGWRNPADNSAASNDLDEGDGQ